LVPDICPGCGYHLIAVPDDFCPGCGLSFREIPEGTPPTEAAALADGNVLTKAEEDSLRNGCGFWLAVSAMGFLALVLGIRDLTRGANVGMIYDSGVPLILIVVALFQRWRKKAKPIP